MIQDECLKVEFVGVVPNSLQDIGRASDGAKLRPVAGRLGFHGDLILL
jgi:hypothetical protein